MDEKEIIHRRVHDYYWKDDINCAKTTLKILAEIFEVPLKDQVLDSATGLHGAGRYDAQCGLVEGALMFTGILGKIHDYLRVRRPGLIFGGMTITLVV